MDFLVYKRGEQVQVILGVTRVQREDGVAMRDSSFVDDYCRREYPLVQIVCA